MSPFESPSKAEHPSRKRSVFARGGSGRKGFSLGTRKKVSLPVPPASGGSKGSNKKLALFRSPSSVRNKSDAGKLPQTTMASYVRVPDIGPQKQSIPDATSVTSVETRYTMRSANNDNGSVSTIGSCSSKPISNELRSQLKDLGANNKRSELLLGQVKVLEAESRRKDEKLRTLNDHLHGIQKGLSKIDEERSSLLTQVKQLEEEKRQIYDQLVLRERECLSLVKRCTSQEERMKESALLRCKNTELETETRELRSAKQDQERQEQELNATKEELEACQKQLEHTKRDHDALAGTLRNCLANIKKLTKEKQEWEDERRRLLNRAEVEIETERLHHVEEMNDLKVCLQSRQDKVEKLEEFMKDKSMTNLMLRKQNAELNKWKTQTSVKLDECERQIAELVEENMEINLEIGKVSGSTDDWAAKLGDKERIIESLEAELETVLSKSMSTSETLDFLQEENGDLEKRVEDLQSKLKSFDGWSQERDAMLQYLSVTQAQIQELMEEVVTLQLENDDLEESKQELLQEVETRRVSVSSVEDLEKDMSEKEVRWQQMENSLRGKVASLEAEVTVLREGADEKAKTSQDAMRLLEFTIASRTRENLSLRKQLDEAIEVDADSANQIKSLENNLSSAMTQNSQSEDKMASLQEQSNRVHEQAIEAQQETAKAESRIRQLEAQLATKNTELLGVHESQRALEQQLQCTIDDLVSKLAAQEKTLARVEEQRQTHDEAAQEMPVLRKKNVELTAQNRALNEELHSTKERILEIETILVDKDNELSNSHESANALREDVHMMTEELEECVSNEGRLMHEVSILKEERDQANTESKQLRERHGHLESSLAAKDRELAEANAREVSLTRQLDENKLVQEELETKITMQQVALHEASKVERQQIGELQSLRSELQKAQTAGLVKDDEIRDLRLIELKDCEEEIEALQEKLKAKDTEISNLVGKLETISLSQLDREHEVSEELSKLKATIATLKREQREKESDWLANGRDAQELKSDAVTLKRRKQLLEKSVESLRREKELILASERSSAGEKKKLECALQREICLREEKNQQLHDSKLTIDSLEKSVSTMSAQKVELAAMLDERTRRLREMVEENRRLQESANAISGSRIDTNEFRDDREELIEKLNREQSIREVLEAEVSTVHAQVAAMKREVKEQGRLKEENADLQAKVKRQEAFLKKKIQREKVLRDRSSSLNVLKAPANVVSPTKSDPSVGHRITTEDSLFENQDPSVAVIIADN